MAKGKVTGVLKISAALLIQMSKIYNDNSHSEEIENIRNL